MKKINQNANGNVQIILVGNKLDLVNERRITKKLGQTKAKQYELEFYEVSARENIQVEECFNGLTELAYNKKYIDENGKKDSFSIKPKI